jgi:hypothetical protein
VCHIIPNIVLTIIGFHINTNNDKTKTVGRYVIIHQKSKCDHNNTKNITMKKSFNDFILLIISNLYDEFANVIPAINVHISIPNPARWNTLHKIKHRHIAKRNKYSCDSAIFSVIFGIRYFQAKNIHQPNHIIFKTNHQMTIIQLESHMFLKVASANNNNITIKS